MSEEDYYWKCKKTSDKYYSYSHLCWYCYRHPEAEAT